MPARNGSSRQKGTKLYDALILEQFLDWCVAYVYEFDIIVTYVTLGERAFISYEAQLGCSELVSDSTTYYYLNFVKEN